MAVVRMPALLARGEEALAAAAGRVDGAGAEDAGDLGVAEIGEMPDGERGTGGIVDGDGGAHAAHAPVQHHHRPLLAIGEAADEGIAQHAAGGEQAVDTALLQQAGECRLFLALDMGPEDEAEAALLGAALGGARDGGIEGVGEIGQHQPQGPGPGHAQAAGGEIGLIAQAPGGLQDPLPGGGAGAGLGMIVQHPGDQAGIDAGARGHVPDGDPLSLLAAGRPRHASPLRRHQQQEGFASSWSGRYSPKVLVVSISSTRKPSGSII